MSCGATLLWPIGTGLGVRPADQSDNDGCDDSVDDDQFNYDDDNDSDGTPDDCDADDDNDGALDADDSGLL